MEPSSNEFGKLILLFTYALCGGTILATAAFSAAAWRAYRNAQISRRKMISILAFLFACFFIPVLVLLLYFPRS